MKKKKKKWVRFHHRIVRTVAYWILYPYTVLRYGVKIEKFREEKKRQFLILLNHQTVFDQFFVGMAFPDPVYYMATEDIFSLGWISSLIRFVVAPIPIKKQTTDVQAVLTCLRVAKEGGAIAIAPEGNRTYSGRTGYMNPAIAGLARKLNLPIALFRIEGGYGVQPRWCDKIRKGKMRAYVSEVIEPEAYQAMTNEELAQKIADGLAVNEAVVDGTYECKQNAEYLERALYTCPICGLAVQESHGDRIRCTKCNREMQYLPTKEFKGIGFQSPFRFVADWYDYQEALVNRLDLTQHTETPLFRDTAKLSEVIVYKRKEKLRDSISLSLYGDRIVIDEGEENALNFPFEGLSAVTVLGRNKLNLYFDQKVYQIKGDARFNALKYVNLFHRYKNMNKENEHGKFLGL